MTIVWQALTDVTIVAHYGFLLYLIVGGFLALWWPRSIWLHALAAVWGVLIVTTRVPCPLTAAQNFFREQSGLAPLRAGFIQLYVRGIFYPASGELAARAVVAALVLVSWLLFARRQHTIRQRARTRRAAPVGR